MTGPSNVRSQKTITAGWRDEVLADILRKERISRRNPCAWPAATCETEMGTKGTLTQIALRRLGDM